MAGEVKNLQWNRFLMQELVERREALMKIIASREKALERAPEGRLRVARKKNNYQYYWRSDPKDTNGIFIPKKKESLAYRLAQKDYDGVVLKCAERELAIVEDYLQQLKDASLEEIYDSYSISRQSLIRPVFIPDKQYIENWKKEYYVPMPFDEEMPKYYSENGVRVRSKSELIIANMLERNGIPYKYEYPLNLPGIGIVRPDFICLNMVKRMEKIWEHFGMMDNISYANKSTQKIALYETNGYTVGENMILTFESLSVPLSTEYIQVKIEQNLLR